MIDVVRYTLLAVVVTVALLCEAYVVVVCAQERRRRSRDMVRRVSWYGYSRR
jgi:hypothetical protein